MSSKDKKRIGLVGCGTIGGHVAKRIQEADRATIDFVCDVDQAKARAVAPNAEVFSDPGEIARRDVDLVVESVDPGFLREIALDVLSRTDLVPFSITALADDHFREAIRARCRESKTRLFVPHGGILGLDGMYDGRAVIDEVTFKTTKHPRNLALADDVSGVVYDGPTRGACIKFPRNVNVHAAFALMGIGFERQRSIVVSDPETAEMRDDVTVIGDGIEWHFTIISKPAGAVTGKYTPESAASTIHRVLGGTYDIVLA